MRSQFNVEYYRGKALLTVQLNIGICLYEVRMNYSSIPFIMHQIDIRTLKISWSFQF